MIGIVTKCLLVLIFGLLAIMYILLTFDKKKRWQMTTYNGNPTKLELITYLKDKVKIKVGRLWKLSTKELMKLKESLVKK